MSEYDPLREHLRNLAASGRTEVTLTFRELEKILGFLLCDSAIDHRPWWGNDRTHSQAQAWLDAGWKVVMADRETEKIIFQRTIQSTKGKRVQNIKNEDSKMASYINVIINTINTGSKEDTVSVWDCPVCKGRGVESDLIGVQTCRACKGERRWKANIQSNQLQTCGRCEGNGTIKFDRILPLGSDVCPICKGSGKNLRDSGKNMI